VAELRPHVPPVRDAVRGRLAGQERQRLRLHDGRPGRPGLRIEGTEYSARYGARVPRTRLRPDDGRVPRHGAAGLRRALRRLVARPPACPRCSATSPTSRAARRAGRDDAAETRRCSRTRSTSTTATGRSTGCSTSPSCRRRSTCAR
jgi:hypothetical protein